MSTLIDATIKKGVIIPKKELKIKEQDVLIRIEPARREPALKIRINASEELIKENPHILTEIDRLGKIIGEILDYRGLRVLEIGYHIILEATKMFSILLGSDAIHAATCKIYEISDIATNDSDFKHVDFFNVWKPFQ